MARALEGQQEDGGVDRLRTRVLGSDRPGSLLWPLPPGQDVRSQLASLCLSFLILGRNGGLLQGFHINMAANDGINPWAEGLGDVHFLLTFLIFSKKILVQLICKSFK